MSEQHWILGGALVNTTVSAVSPETPVDLRVQPTIGKFLGLLAKSYSTQKEEEFLVFFDGFLEEVDRYLDDSRISKELLSKTSTEAEFSSEEILDLENFMDKVIDQDEE